MNVDEPAAPAAQHYSGRNRVPNIQEFMQQLDKEKKDRDAEIDQQLKQNKKHGEVKEHKIDHQRNKEKHRTVRDPVTGKDVEIRDTNLSYEDAVENPQVSFAQTTGPPCPLLTGIV
jgi:hypothetical protein